MFKLLFSTQAQRNKAYQHFLKEMDNEQKTLADIIALGEKMLRRARVFHHYYLDRQMKTIAAHLSVAALGMATDSLEHNPELARLPISPSQAQAIFNHFEQRIAHRKPVEYITNEAYYLGRKFYVNEHVLVPRSIINTRFEDFLKETHWTDHRVLDMCAGSGVIGITLALMKPELIVDLVDISPEAVRVANENIKRFNLSDRVRCIQSDLFTNVDGKYDLIISNPPYVTPFERWMSPKEFKQEPHIALVSGNDGLDLTHQLLREAKHYLNPQGQLIVEVGFTATGRLKKAYRNVKFTWYKYRCPQGKEAFMGMHGSFACRATDLP